MLRFAAALVVLLALAAYLGVRYLTGGNGTPRCEVAGAGDDGESYSFTPEQAANAATIAAVGTTRGMPERAVTIALATALQESRLRNIAYGDRDSLGLFQQRPSQGWGTEKQIMDPVYAAGEFYAHLAKVRGYTEMPLTVAAQRVQRSGFPEAYAKHEPDAALLAAALTGRAAATLTCEGRQTPGVTGGPDAVRAALVRDFGNHVLGAASATAPAGADAKGAGQDSSAGPSVSATSASPSAPAERTVTVPVRVTGASDAETRRRGWELAHWAVANAAGLRVERVAYENREWVAGGRDGAWRKPRNSGAAEGPATARAALDEVRIVTGQ